MSKKVLIIGLSIINFLIIGLGTLFIIYCIYFNVSIKVMNANVPGALFGLMVLYYGIRYFMKLNNLKKEIYKPESRFLWSNFKKIKKGEVL